MTELNRVKMWTTKLFGSRRPKEILIQHDHMTDSGMGILFTCCLALDCPKTVGKVPFPIHMMDRKKNRSCQYVIRSQSIPKSEKCSKQRKLV